MGFAIRQCFKMLCQHVIFPFLYFINRWRSLDRELIILADAHHDTCPPHMEALSRRLSGQRYRVIEWFMDSASAGTWTAFRYMAKFMKLYAQASYVFICDNYLPVSSCRKRRETKVIQLWHGCGAFKKFGYDTEEDIPKEYRGNVYKNYDLVTVSGDACVPFFCSAMRIPEQNAVVLPLGVSHTDRLFDADYIARCRDRFRYIYPDAAGKRVVLWAPTFRKNAARAELSGESYIDALIGDKSLGEDIYIIKSLHPHLKRGDSAMSTDELLVCADILITDYSSVFFEYLLLDRPIIFFAPDYGVYANSRGFYQIYDELPGYVVAGNGYDKSHREMNVFLQEELARALVSVIGGQGARMKKLRDSYRANYMNLCDGNATVRILKYVFGGDELIW